MIEILLCGAAYVIMVYFMVRLLKKKNIKFPPDDSDDGGLEIDNFPKIDLPPGVVWPGDSPRGKIRNEEQERISS